MTTASDVVDLGRRPKPNPFAMTSSSNDSTSISHGKQLRGHRCKKVKVTGNATAQPKQTPGAVDTEVSGKVVQVPAPLIEMRISNIRHESWYHDAMMWSNIGVPFSKVVENIKFWIQEYVVRARRFKIGITGQPANRFTHELYGYSDLGYEAFYLCYTSPNSTGEASTNELEIILTKHFSSHPRCENKDCTGKTPTPKWPHFLYVVTKKL